METPARRPVVVRLLVRGHLRTRWRRFALVSLSFGIGLFGFFLVVMIAEGAREAVTEPMRDLLTGDVRILNGTTDLSGGHVWEDYRGFAAELERDTGVVPSPRLESNYITVRGQNYQNWSAGLLLGVDPDDAREADNLRGYIVWGTPIASLDVFDPDTGRAYPPLVLGKSAAARLNVTLNDTGQPDFGQVLTLTSGRLRFEGTLPVPLVIECVLVGVFETGLEPADKFTGFIPIQTARVLAGHREGDPVANAFVLRGVSLQQVEDALADHPEMRATSAEDFSFYYMGGMLVILYVAAFAGIGLFFTVLLVWLVHETGVLIRTDQAVLSSLRAIGIPARGIFLSYATLSTASVAAGALGALLVALALGFLAPPMQWSLSGLHASIPWRLHPTGIAVATVSALLASFATSWATSRRIQRLNILEGLRGA